MMDILVITDDGVEDPISTVLAADAKSPWRVSSQKASEFITAGGASFSAEDGMFHFQGQNAGSPAQAQPVVLNRVIEVSDRTISALGAGRSLLTRGQVTHALANVLSTYKRVLGSPGVCSPVGNLVPLVSQWKLLSQRFPSIRTPEYKYGYGPEPIDHLPFQRPIWKSPFDFYSWKVSDTAPKVHYDSFVVNRPEGVPVLVYFFGKAWHAQFLAAGQELSAEQRARLGELLPFIRETFGALTGECLLFAEGSSLTFASFSHYLTAAARQPPFLGVLQEGLAAELG
jgi:hypothetical protein